MAGVTQGRECVHCARENPVHWTVCGNCGKNPWVPDAPDAPADAVQDSAGATTTASGTTHIVTLPDFTELRVAPGERLTIGRETGVDAIDVALEPYLDVSRIHLAFESAPTGFVVTDAGSTYGTWLEGERVHPGSTATVAPGQRLRLGKNCYLKVTEHDG